MKCDTRKLSPHQGSSTDWEAGPLFPPLHVNDTGKAGMRAPPRNKMALFEQFTVPYKSSNKGMSAEAASQQHGRNDFFKTYTHHSLPPTTKLSSVVGGIGKPSYGSSLGSLSTCSAVLNVDQAEKFQVQEPGDDTSLFYEPKLGMVPAKSRSQLVKVSKEYSQKMKVAKSVCLSPHVDDKGEACGQAVCLAMKGFHKWDKGLIRGGNLISEDTNVKGQSCQEDTTNLKNPNLKGRSYPEATLNAIEKADASNSVEPKAQNQLKSTDDCALGSAVDVIEKPVASSQGDVPPMATLAPISICDKMSSSLVPSLPVIKPKDVIHAVGQQHFWKARKAILRQQEVFSNQVFELHKLIEVQKLLAKMPSNLMDERLLSGMAFDKVDLDFYPVKVNSKKQEKSYKGIQQLPGPQKCEGLVHESRPPQRILPREEREREGEVIGTDSHTKRRSQHSYSSQALTNASFNQAHHTSSSDKASAWGYPMGSLNRPFLYPPNAGHFPSVSGYGGAYVVGSNPPMAPFTFPCYTPRPEQQPPIFCLTNQWSTPMYHNSFYAPTANDWFGMNHLGQFPLASGSEKPGPTNSVPSINMKAEASSQSVQPPVVPLSQRQQVGSSSRTELAATKSSFGSVATASVCTQPDALSGKPAGSIPNLAGGSRFIPKVWGAFGCEARAACQARGQLKGTKEEAQLPLCSREEGLDSVRAHGLNLFPLQPSIISGGASEGRVQEGGHGGVIKAIPRSALAASESAAGILLSIQRERQQ